MKKIISKKRNVKKKIKTKKRKVKIIFDKMRHHPQLQLDQWNKELLEFHTRKDFFNRLDGVFTEKAGGDPFLGMKVKDQAGNVFTIPLIRKLTGKGVTGSDCAGHEETMDRAEVRVALPPGVTKEEFLRQYGPRGIVESLEPHQKKVNERESDLTDALRYSMAQIDASDKDPYKIKKATRGDLGTAPAHYSHGKLEPWDVVKDWGLDYFTGCALKYVCRHKHKGTPVQDIQKAIDYLVEYKKNLENEVS